MWFGRKQERQRYYLLPGMGGSARKRKKAMILRWSLATGLFTSLLVAFLLRWISSH